MSSAQNLVRAAEQLGFECRAGTLDLATLRTARFPIVYLDGKTLGRSFPLHAVVVEELTGVVVVLDPAVGRVELPLAEFDEAWRVAGSFALVIRQKTS